MLTAAPSNGGTLDAYGLTGSAWPAGIDASARPASLRRCGPAARSETALVFPLSGGRPGLALCSSDSGGRLIILTSLALPSAPLTFNVLDADGDGRDDLLAVTGEEPPPAIEPPPAPRAARRLRLHWSRQTPGGNFEPWASALLPNPGRPAQPLRFDQGGRIALAVRAHEGENKASIEVFRWDGHELRHEVTLTTPVGGDDDFFGLAPLRGAALLLTGPGYGRQGCRAVLVREGGAGQPADLDLPDAPDGGFTERHFASLESALWYWPSGADSLFRVDLGPDALPRLHPVPITGRMPVPSSESRPRERPVSPDGLLAELGPLWSVPLLLPGDPPRLFRLDRSRGIALLLELSGDSARIAAEWSAPAGATPLGVFERSGRVEVLWLLHGVPFCLPAGLMSAPSPEIPWDAKFLGHADVTGDGREDLHAVGMDELRYRWRYPPDSGPHEALILPGAAQPPWFCAPRPAPYARLNGDVDGNGSSDLITVESGVYAPGVVQPWFWSSAEPGKPVRPGGRRLQPPLLGDFDGTGRDEAVCAGDSGVVLVAWDRSGELAERAVLYEGILGAPLGSGDIDGDGRIESIWWEDGEITGRAVEAGKDGSRVIGQRCMALRVAPARALRPGDPQVRFLSLWPPRPGLDRMLAADLDGDGADELCWADHDSVRVLRPKPAPRITAVAPVFDPECRERNAVRQVLDLDRDGRPDLIGGPDGGGAIWAVLDPLGNVRFESGLVPEGLILPEEKAGGPYPTGAPFFTDLDGDGTFDLVIARNRGVRVIMGTDHR